MRSLFTRLKGLSPYAVLFIRLAFGFHLLYYAVPPLWNGTVVEGAEWLGSLGVPFPVLMSWLYILTEFLGGIMLIVGFQTRLVAIPLIITFLVAYFLVHGGDPYEDSFQALQMLAVSCYFLFHGSGKLSIDEAFKLELAD